MATKTNTKREFDKESMYSKIMPSGARKKEVVDDGINEEEALKINEFILKRMKDVVSYDLVEFNPLRDIDRKTEQIALNLLAQIISYAKNKNKYDNKKPLY